MLSNNYSIQSLKSQNDKNIEEFAEIFLTFSISVSEVMSAFL